MVKCVQCSPPSPHVESLICICISSLLSPFRAIIDLWDTLAHNTECHLPLQISTREP